MNKRSLFAAMLVATVLIAPASVYALSMPNQNINLAVRVGQSVEATLPLSSSGQWLAYNLTGESLASAVVLGTVVRITGNSAGLAKFQVCTDTSKMDCFQIQVEVTNGVKGSVLGLSTERHAVGTWVKYKNTVFYVHERGLIPVPSMKVFTSNGGKASQIELMSQGDLELPPYLPELSLNDSRLQ